MNLFGRRWMPSRVPGGPLRRWPVSSLDWRYPPLGCSRRTVRGTRHAYRFGEIHLTTSDAFRAFRARAAEIQVALPPVEKC